MKKQLLLLVLILLPMVASADAVEIDGIYYNLISKTKEAAVTTNPNKYSGSLVIPGSVTYEGETYSVTSIGWDAFQDCYYLINVTIPNSVTSIGGNAFLNCKGLTSINIPNSVTNIGGYAFEDCTNLVSIIIPNSVTSINDGTFIRCTSLTSIDIPNSVTSIGASAFYYCSGLSTITIPNSVTTIGKSAFLGCTGLTLVTIPNSVTSIGASAFDGCKALKSIDIPNSVKNIGRLAFAGCTGLITISIGSGISSIGSLAFKSCSELSDIYCYAENVPNTSNDAFNNSYIDYATLHVPEESVDAYKAAAPWSGFKNIVKIMPMYTLTYMIDDDIYKSYQVEEGATITPEAEPTKEGYTFSGWSEIPATMPAHDVTVTGTFNINMYKLIYKVDGEVYKTYDVEFGATITSEEEPTKEGYTFSGWSEIPAKMPAKDVTITGSFSVNKYKLTYKVDGEVYRTYDVEYSATITPEAAPTKEGYTDSIGINVPPVSETNVPLIAE